MGLPNDMKPKPSFTLFLILILMISGCGDNQNHEPNDCYDYQRVSINGKSLRSQIVASAINKNGYLEEWQIFFTEEKTGKRFCSHDDIINEKTVESFMECFK